MKKALFFGIAFLFFNVQAWAAPFLVCDPDATGSTDEYVLSFDGGTDIITAYPLSYDLSGLSDGNHQVTVKGRNVWGDSPPVPFDFTKGVPGLPQTIRISSE